VRGAEIVVLAGSAGLIVALAWFFFGPKRARLAEVRGRTQEVVVTVKGGYSPDLIRVRQGMPLRLVFDRQESGECTSRVVFPDFGVSKSLPAFGKATVELTPDRAGKQLRSPRRSLPPTPMRWPERLMWGRRCRSQERTGWSFAGCPTGSTAPPVW
jgi:Cupredoxin-like domain